MKTHRVTDSVTGVQFTITVEDGATAEEVMAVAQAEAAKVRQRASEPEEIVPPAPPPPPWRVAGRDPNEDLIRCTHCGQTKKRRELGRHLAEHPEVTGGGDGE